MTAANFRLTVALGERKVKELGGTLSLSLKVSLILKTEIHNFIDFQNVSVITNYYMEFFFLVI